MGSVGTYTTQFNALTSGNFKEVPTDSEIKSIRSITGGTWKSVSSAENMNKQLRKYGTGALTNAGNIMRQNLDNAIGKYELLKDIQVHRAGSSDMIGGYNNISDIQKLVGKTVQDNGYTSTSVDKEVAKMFSGNIMYHMDIKKGSKDVGMFVGDYSKHAEEKEFLTARRNQYTIKSVYEKNGMIHVNLSYSGKGSYDIQQSYYKQWLDSQ